ncbi:MAG: choice-of-anchor D domain-containing protein [bacterium]|nr:choice-of-anchor D domain-containing protein [bacterium]
MQQAPLLVNFAQRQIATTATRQITISNLGGLPLTGSVSLSGSSTFSFTGGSFTLAAGETQAVTVTFSPQTAGVFDAALTVSSNDSDESQTDVALTGTGVAQLSGPGTRVASLVKATLRVGNVIDTGNAAAVDAFIADLRAILAQLLGISADRVRILSVTEGSTIVQFQIATQGTQTAEPTAAEAMASLAAALAETSTDEFSDLGGTESFADETADVVLQPVDASGEPILGWFTFGSAGTQVGFDDFFLFADHFGVADSDPSFEAIYDIAPADEPNGIVDFDDFFRFADDFGKQVANGQEIIDIRE